MSEIGIWFQRGGFFMYVILGLGVLGGVGAIIGLVLGLTARSRGLALVLGLVVTVLGLITAAVGGAAYLRGQQVVHEALAYADPDVRPQLRARGMEEAAIPLKLGVASAALPVLAGGTLLLVGALRRRPN